MLKSLKRKITILGAMLTGGLTIAILLGAGSAPEVMARHN
jgi:hypothetical protein